MTRSALFGENTSAVEVTNISKHGLWLFAAGRELFLPYSEFPWFRDAPISSIFKVEESSPGHFYWPDLDVDLGLETVEHPERFPLKYDFSLPRSSLGFAPLSRRRERGRGRGCQSTKA